MRAIVLEPNLLDIVFTLGLQSEICAISSLCNNIPPDFAVPRVNARQQSGGLSFGPDTYDLAEIGALSPDVILGMLPDESPQRLFGRLKEESARWSEAIGKPVRVCSFRSLTLEDVFASFEGIGAELGAAARGREVSQRMRAQMLDWCHNFYDRMKHKKVAVCANLSRPAPASWTLAGYWVTEMIQLCSCASLQPQRGATPKLVVWEEIARYRPDVLVLSIDGMSPGQAGRMLSALQQLQGWEDVPAVMRGEVVFADGRKHFNHPTYEIVESMAVLVSAIAGLESGYITPRDSFYRLRWVELHRHRLETGE